MKQSTLELWINPPNTAGHSTAKAVSLSPGHRCDHDHFHLDGFGGGRILKTEDSDVGFLKNEKLMETLGPLMELWKILTIWVHLKTDEKTGYIR